MVFSSMPVQLPGNSAPKQSCVHSPGTSSLLISASLAQVQIHEPCVCPRLVLNAYLHPQDHQDPVFDLMCVPTVMHAKKVQSNGRFAFRGIAI